MMLGYALISSERSTNNMISNLMVVSSQHNILYQVTTPSKYSDLHYGKSSLTWCSPTARSQTLYKETATQSSKLFSIVLNLKKVPPFHVFVAQAIHDVSRSKKLINIMNCLGISINYHEMLQIDTLLAPKLIQDAGRHCVPVTEEIKSDNHSWGYG